MPHLRALPRVSIPPAPMGEWGHFVLADEGWCSAAYSRSELNVEKVCRSAVCRVWLPHHEKNMELMNHEEDLGMKKMGLVRGTRSEFFDSDIDC